MYRIFDLFRFLVVPMDDGDFHAVVRTIFQNDDGTTVHSDNYHSEFGFPTLANADQIAVSNYNGSFIVTKVGPGEFEIEFAGKDKIIEWCYACGWLYHEDRKYQQARYYEKRQYDPTDFECGCTGIIEGDLLMDLDSAFEDFGFEREFHTEADAIFFSHHTYEEWLVYKAERDAAYAKPGEVVAF